MTKEQQAYFLYLLEEDIVKYTEKCKDGEAFATIIDAAVAVSLIRVAEAFRTAMKDEEFHQ